MVTRGAEKGREMGWEGRGGEEESGRHLPKDAGGGGCDKGKNSH